LNWDRVIEVLFNTNHELPSIPMMIGIGLVCILVNYWAQKETARRQAEKDRLNNPRPTNVENPAWHAPKKKKRSKKK